MIKHNRSRLTTLTTEIMKQIINITLTLTILFAGMNVYADGDKKNNSKNSTTEKVIAKIETAFDTELSLEAWMTEIKNFYNKESFTENALHLEKWMTKSFLVNEMTFAEEELMLEDWMTVSFEFSDEQLVLEDWMTESFNTEDKFTEEELQFEDWMFDLTK